MEESVSCPECRESVQEGATKCPHCASDLPSKSTGYTYIVIGILLLPVSGVFLYLTSSAVDIGGTFLLAFSFFEMIIWGGVIGVLLAIGLSGPVLIVKGIGEISEYNGMRSSSTVSESGDSATEEFRKGYRVNKEEREEKVEKVKEKTERRVEGINDSVDRFVSTLTDPDISSLNFLRPFGVILGTVLWLSIWVLIDNLFAFGFALIGGWIILPIALLLDIRTVNRREGAAFHWWAYVLLSLIPMVAPIFGLLWLFRRKQKTGRVF